MNNLDELIERLRRMSMDADSPYEHEVCGRAAVVLTARLQAAKDAGREEALDIVKSCFEDKDEDYDDDEQSAWTDGAVFVQHIASKAIRERIGKP